MDNKQIESVVNSYEEIFIDHEIYIQPDRDPYRGGFEWSVCREGVELEAGLEFSIEDALIKAQGVVKSLKLVVSPAP
jgi:hypothetical protein